ncbi:2-C-methyl-D-erythritol 4-phosphate cytidylyltransferase [Lachnospiraceae bacterium]|jgi:2-C-methyl-D-erythritol 4-phosphate cytidylyltransferase|nr:IspD/TarI family cytidylyltransferase [uncultured Schaedlerella sp.]NBI58717.1 2-C-methyl-D-erythritol 4-phosphate cytidylyltransferase [Lachnospiraceae bacterium]
MNIALLTAAGMGSRMHLDIPKQFLHIEGKPIILYTMEAFQRHPQIDAMIVVTLENWKENINAYARNYQIDKLKWITVGGKTGQESIKNGINELSKYCRQDDVVMVHDGNRPFVSEELISDSLATYKEYGSAVAAMPCIEAIFRSANGRTSNETIPREQLFRTQTPHTYNLGKMLWAHRKAEELRIENTTATCVLMQMLGEEIYFSKGSEKNLKLTTHDELDIFKAMIRKEVI